MSQLTDDDIEYIVGEAKNELRSLAASRYRQVTRSEDSFVAWLRNQIYDAARAVGLTLSMPFRVVWDAIRGFFDGLFR